MNQLFGLQHRSNRMAFIRKADIEKMLAGNPYHRVLPGASSNKKSSRSSSYPRMMKRCFGHSFITQLLCTRYEPTHEASAEPSLFELCLARRRKTDRSNYSLRLLTKQISYKYE